MKSKRCCHVLEMQSSISYPVLVGQLKPVQQSGIFVYKSKMVYSWVICLEKSSHKGSLPTAYVFLCKEYINCTNTLLHL